jgi:hypothetical protein
MGRHVLLQPPPGPLSLPPGGPCPPPRLSLPQRFRPITVERPKVLLPLVNAPLIEYTLEWLALNRVEEVGRGGDTAGSGRGVGAPRAAARRGGTAAGLRWGRASAAGSLSWAKRSVSSADVEKGAALAMHQAAAEKQRPPCHDAAPCAPGEPSVLRPLPLPERPPALQIYLFCCAHADQIKKYLSESKWLKQRSPKIITVGGGARRRSGRRLQGAARVAGGQARHAAG